MSEQTSAAQSAPAGEREAFDKWFRAEQLIADHIDTTFISSAFLPYKAFQAGASWQRTQSAGVPEGWRLVPEVPNEAIRDAIDLLCDDASAFDDSEAFWHYLLAAAPAQPAAHHIEQALDMVTPAKSEVQRLREALTQLLSYAERQICAHDNTHRGGAIWEICDDCGAKWADDEGGKPEFKWSNEIEAARAALAASTGQEVGK